MKTFKNRDVIKRLGTRNLAKVLGCSESTINAWTKKGLGRVQVNMSTFNDMATNKVNSFRIDDVVSFLKEHKKEKYLINLEKYLDVDYKCNICRQNVATSESIDGHGFICGDCAKQYE